ncbi:MAG: hypothetical protein H6623_05960 [Bdellovibrionaceae bacterium]|nr:hypothetical protein [Pseudobdellovibrionaceae bacterium]
MFKSLLLLALLALSPLASADSLKDIMSAMGNNAKMIALELKNTQLTQQSLDAAKTIDEEVVLADMIVPKTANTPDLENQYHQLMTRLKEQSSLLVIAIQESLKTDGKNTTDSAAIFKKMMAIRQEGHQLFKD